METSYIYDYIYPIVITLIFLGGYSFVVFRIQKEQKKKLRFIKKRDIHDAVETDSPLPDQENDLKRSGAEAIEERFSFINKSVPLVLFLLWLFFISIPYLGDIPSVYVSIVAAVVSVIAGFSLRPFLENLFAGVIITFFKSIKIGDTVIIDGHYGLMEEIGLAYSIIKRWDWVRIVIPNSKLLQKEIQNLTMKDEHIWAYVEFYVAPGEDLKKVESLCKEVAKSSPHFRPIEGPSFWVMGLEKDSVKCWLASWAKNPSDAWELRNEMRTGIYMKLQENGISFHQLQIRPLEVESLNEKIKGH